MKPRLTKKVLEGLGAMAAAISAGDALAHGGDLKDSADEVEAAMRWVNAMRNYRAGRADELAMTRRNKAQSTL